MLDSLALFIPLPHTDPTLTPAPILPPRKLLQRVENSDDYILHIDNSTLEKFNQCNRQAENYCVRSREQDRDQSAQSFGRLFHLCEEARLKGGIKSEELAKVQQRIVTDHFRTHGCSPEDHRTADRMLQVLTAYNKLYENDMWAMNIQQQDSKPMVEIGFSLPLCTIPVNEVLPYSVGMLVTNPQNPEDALKISHLHIHWTGRIDAILSNSSSLWVVDHKTTSSGGREFEEAFRLASQTIGYCWAAEQLTSQPIAGCIINQVLIRPPAKTARASLAREEFQRLTYFYSQDRINEWRESVQHIVADFVSCLIRGYFPLTGPRSFKSPCTYCDYHENCQLPRHQRAADLASALYRNVTWNPLNPDA